MKTYISPVTENVLLSSSAIMQDALSINTASGTSFNDATLID